MTETTARLGRDSGLRDRFVEALDRYRERRDSLAIIETTPPGGGPERVKCLHAHLAHELADPPNPVGALTLARTGWPDCIRPCVEAVDR
jgi:hypothetical protein